MADYPLVEAISQNVVKHPVLPDAPSRAKLVERKSAKFTEKYADYINLGVIEWRKAYAEHEKLGKKAILFVMTDDTRNCDDVAAYLEGNYADLKDAVLVIHTKSNGEISESTSGKSKEELNELRKLANDDRRHGKPLQSHHLRDGPQRRLGRAQRDHRSRSARLFRGEQHPARTDVWAVACAKCTPAAWKNPSAWLAPTPLWTLSSRSRIEGVTLDHKPMGEGTAAKTPLVVEVDNENPKKDIDELGY